MTAPVIVRVLRRRRASGRLVFDSFDREDNAASMGTADTGELWTATGLTAGIQGGMAYFPTVSGFGISTVETLHGDVDVSCNLILRTVQDQSRGGLIVRSDGTTANRWTLTCDFGGTNLVLTKTVANTSTSVVTTPLAITLGQSYTVRLVAKGPSWTVYVNGLSIITATDSALVAMTRCGLAAVRATSAVGSPLFDNFSIAKA